MRGTVKTWEGGYVRESAKGKSFYVIRRRVNGAQFEFSTRATTLKAAMEQLKRFEADPANYDPSGPEKKEPIRLSVTLAEEFLLYSLLPRREGEQPALARKATTVCGVVGRQA